MKNKCLNSKFFLNKFNYFLLQTNKKFSENSSCNNVNKKTVYLDFQATTPLDPEVLDSMLPYMTQDFGNPHSRTHNYGWEAEKAIENSRKLIADLIKADSKEIIFTSGATESNNLALKGLAEFYKDKKKHIIVTQIDHKCILDTARNLEYKGYEVTYLPVLIDGTLDLNLLTKSIRPDTLLVSCIFLHNEIGVIQPIKEIGKICKEKKVYFHTDAAQAVGKIPIDVNDMNIDLMSFTSHKIYGPKGIGALYMRKKNPRVRLTPQINGGGQERGFRSGTLSPFVRIFNFSLR